MAPKEDKLFSKVQQFTDRDMHTFILPYPFSHEPFFYSYNIGKDWITANPLLAYARNIT